MNWTKTEGVIWEELDGGALLVDSASGKRCSLNATAAALWKLCDGSRTAGELASVLSRPINEVAEFCRSFAALGLLSRGTAVRSAGMCAFQTTLSSGPEFKLHGLGAGPRRRPGPSGISGPA